MKNNVIAMNSLDANERGSLERLISVAKNGTGQSETVANFLLAWWNADSCGGFNLTELWAVDSALVEDMVNVFKLVEKVRNYPDTLGYLSRPAFINSQTCIYRVFRPELSASIRSGKLRLSANEPAFYDFDLHSIQTNPQ